MKACLYDCLHSDKFEDSQKGILNKSGGLLITNFHEVVFYPIKRIFDLFKLIMNDVPCKKTKYIISSNSDYEWQNVTLI